jgi:hypothetical protein
VAVAVAVAGAAVAGCGHPAAAGAATTVMAVAPTTVYGARVGWLPAGLAVLSDVFLQRVEPAGQSGLVDTQMVAWVAPGDLARARAGAAIPTYAVTVVRTPADGASSLTDPADWHPGALRPPWTSASTTPAVVGGRPAALSRLVGAARAAWQLYWTGDPPGGTAVPQVAVTVGGPDEAAVRRIAQSVTVGPRPQGAVGALAQLTAAATAAFDGASGVAMASAVDDPGAVLPGIRAALREHPAALRAVAFAGLRPPPAYPTYAGQPPPVPVPAGGTVLAAVVFLSDTEAQANLAWLDGVGGAGRTGWAVRFERTAAGWKVRRTDFCAALTGVVSCPVTPSGVGWFAYAPLSGQMAGGRPS